MIGKTGVDRALRHAVEACGRRVLDQDQTAGRLDLLQALRAVGAGAGQDDGDCSFPSLGGERGEQYIDRMAMSPRLGWF